MAYKMSEVGGFGTGALGDITNPSGQINSYANVTALNGTSVTIGTPSNGIYETFAVGKEILLHVSALAAGSNTAYLGKYMVATITGVAGSVLTLSKDPTGLLPAVELTNHHVQAITIAQFATLNLSATIAPLAYNATNKYGGVIALKCKTALNISGSGKIDLAAKGIPIGSIALRPATTQEAFVAVFNDSTNQIGWENHITARNLYLNCPDGAAFIVVKTLANTGTSTRIGGSTAGVALYPYNGGSVSNTAVTGGPSILMAAETVTGFTVDVVSKTSSNASGRGLGRCYIATETDLPADEGLYALDCLSNPARIKGLGIKDFGTGALGNVTALPGQINSYAPVTGISPDGRTLTIGTKYEGVYEKFDAGNRVMFHVSRQVGSDQASVGKFIVAEILSVSGNTIVLDTSVSSAVVVANAVSNYRCQLVTMAQFNNLTLSDYSGYVIPGKDYVEAHGCGGLLAVAVKETINLKNNGWLLSGVGIPQGVTRAFVAHHCPGRQADYLPISSGAGALFLLAKNVLMDSSTRLVTSREGARCGVYDGGAGGCGYGGPGNKYWGFPGGITTQASFFAGGNAPKNETGTGGVNSGGNRGCRGVADTVYFVEAAAGGSLFLVADAIDGFNINAFALGGIQGQHFGGSGGGPGSSFIYANTITNPSYTAYLAS